MKDKVTHPRFISDKPQGIDLFEGGSHDKIAESISKYINHETSEIKLIGLDGAWGSGKSNVIEILKKKYLKDSHHIFVFDAWGHQEDLQRRAILEELTSNLIENGILPEKTFIENDRKNKEENSWKDLLKNLLARKREIHSKEIPHLSNGIILIISAIIFTPIFKAIGETLESHQIIKILITALPLIICSIWFGILLWKKKITFSELYAIYNNKKLENTVYESVSEKEPSVSEFRNWMNHLSRDLVKNDKKLIVVFDNMDRLLQIKVKALWSSIHTFFAECNYPNIWVIVPFDRDQIKGAFLESDQSEEKTYHFINKTFSAIYRVTPPILTDWHKFFKLKYIEAFGETESTEYNLVKSVFDLTQNNITPRNIIAFINDIVSEKKLVGCEVSLRYIAVFSVYKKIILRDPVNQILKPTFLGSLENLFKDDSKLSDNIASLVYNLPYESAKQITLTQYLKNTLRDKDIKVINEYAKQKHFLEMLEKVINQEELQLENTIITIGSIEKNLIKDLDSQKMNVIWDTLCGKQLSNSINDQTFNDPLRFLLLNISDDKKERFVKYLVFQISNFKEFQGNSFYIALIEIKKLIKEKNYKIDLFKFLTSITKTPEIFLDFVKVSKQEFNDYKLSCNEKELIEFIITKVPNELEDLDQIKYISSIFNFTKIVEKISQCIMHEEVTLKNLVPFFELYKLINKERPIEYLSDPEIYSLLIAANSNSQEYYELISMRLARGSDFAPEYNSGILLSILSQQEEPIVTEIAKRIEWYLDLDSLLDEAIDSSYPLLISTIRKIISDGSINSVLDILSNIPRSQGIVDTLGISYIDLINFFDGWSDYVTDGVNKENVTTIVTDINFIENSTKIENDLTRHIIKVYIDHLESVSVEQWLESFKDEKSFYFQSLYWLIVEGKLKNLPDNAITASKDLLILIARSQVSCTPSIYRNSIFAKINRNKLKPTIKNVRDAFINEVTITPEIFNFFAEMLIEDGKLDAKPDDVTRRILTPVAADDNCLGIIIKYSDILSTVINSAGDDSSDIKDIVRLKLQTTSGIDGLITFAKKIGVKFNKNQD